MSRIHASTPDTFQFRQNDTGPIRTQKLERIRDWIVAQIEADLAVEIEPVREESDVVRAWWRVAPAASDTLIVWPFTDEMSFKANFAGAVGFLGGTVAAPAVINLYKNPTFTGATITGGTLIGTVTIGTDGKFTFATTGGASFTFEPNDTLAAKWPAVTEAAANGGAFALKAILGRITTFGLLLAGDQQSTGHDRLLLYGDQQTDGNDLLQLVGG